MTLKKIITDFMESKDNYSRSDEVLIDELIFNFKMIKEAKRDLLARGQILNKNETDSQYDRVNKSMEIYNTSLKNMTGLFVRLGISPKERISLKIQMAETKDEFDETFS